ncbi:BTB/POZ and MATH domain-containing protein 2-like [Carex rostrata]
MENSASQKHIKVVHHFKFEESEMKRLESEQFVSSPVFHALGTEWVIDCYPQGSRLELCLHASFIVRLRGKYKVVNPTISLSLMKRDGKTYTLPKQYLKRDEVETFTYAIQKSPFRQQVFAYGELTNSNIQSLLSSYVKDGSVELICSMNSTDTPQTFEVVKSFDLHSQIGKLLERGEGGSFLEIWLRQQRSIFKSKICPLRYAIQGLKALCEDMLCSPISLDTVTTTLALAQQLNSTRIKNACLDFIVEPGTLAKWMLSDKYEDLIRSFPSIMDEIRARVDTGPPFKIVKKRKRI